MFYGTQYTLAPKSDPITEVVTRIGGFLGLDFTTNLTLEMNSNKYLSTIPSFSFSSDFTRVLIDYSNSQNNTDLTLLKGLFSGLTVGVTFNISNASYFIDGPGSEANLGGTYQFYNFIGNMIVAKPVSLNNFNQRLLRYESQYFTTPPQFGLSLSPQGGETQFIIVNALGTDKINSFGKFGIYKDDKIKISGTQFNNNIFTVKSVTINKDGTENLEVEEPIIQESGFGNIVGIELIQKTKTTEQVVAATGPTILGSCGIYENGILVFCFEDQTYSQCVARTTLVDGNPFTWNPNSSCSSMRTSLPVTTSFANQTSTTNPMASLAGLGYFSSTNSVYM